MKPITHKRILVVDDHPLLREGVIAVIAHEPDMSVEWEADNGVSAIEQYRIHRPDIVLMDLRMPVMGGTEAIEKIVNEFSEAKILVLTTYRGDMEAFCAMLAGARGYLLKDAIRTELADAIRQVHAGKRRVGPELGALREHESSAHLLTARELAVLKCLAEGRSNRQIAEALHIAELTIKVHLKSIYGKLDARDRTHAVVIAIRRGVIAIQRPG